MKLKKYIENLIELSKENPESLNMDVVFANNEGDYFIKLGNNPTLGIFDQDSHEFQYEEDHEKGEINLNAICIN